MKIKIEKTQGPTAHQYPMVMVADSGRVAIAYNEVKGVYFFGQSVVFIDNGATWKDAGYKPATGPVTITLEND